MKTILLSGPGKNALSAALMERMLGEVRTAGDAPLFLVGDGDAFSAGLDLKELAALDVAGMTRFLGLLEELVAALYEHPAPVVAWINGHAIAGGCVMALTADLRIMTARAGARIGLNEVALGLRFPPVTFLMTRRRVPAPALERVLLEAALYEAADARHLGLIDAIGEEAEARAMLSKLAAHPREVFAEAKRTMRGRLDVPDHDEQRFRDETIPHWCSPEIKRRVAAALAKR